MFSDSSSTTTTESEPGYDAAEGYIPVSMSDLSDRDVQGAPCDGRGNLYTKYRGMALT